MKIEEIVVTAERRSLTALTDGQARAALRQVPGAIGFVTADDFRDSFTQSLGDTLVFTPGVFADTAAQRENRISIRGSGLNSSFERRGITVLRDGVPITRASGSTEFQEIDPLSTQYIEVFKGANGLRYGASSLGGAINIVTPTGRTANDRFSARIEGGSFDTFRANATVAQSDESFDFYAGATGLTSNGFRDHSRIRSAYGFANAGWRINDAVETRFYLTALADHFELAGSLTREDALRTPRRAQPPVTVGPFFPGGPLTVLDPGPIADDWDRNLDVIRLSNKTVARFDAVTAEAGAWYSWRGLDHAITRFAGIIDQSENEFGAFAALSNSDAQAPFAWTLGVQGNTATNDAKTWANASGQRGALTSQSDQDSNNVTAYAQTDIAMTDTLRAIGGVQYARAVRDVDAKLNALSGRRSYEQLNPRIGLLWQVSEEAQLFANVNRSFEPPAIADLTAGGATPFAPLLDQKAWTVEAGTRGRIANIAWDAAVYRSWLKDEMLDFGAPGARGFVSFTANADRTLHQGLEIGIDALFEPEALAAQGLSVTWRQVYTLSDFKFRSDRTYGGNTLAGVPRHVYASELRLDSQSGWTFGVSFRLVPTGPFVDFANTTRAPGYRLWGLNAAWNVTETIRVYANAENLFDKAYISNVTTNANQRLERASAYTPGQGRAFYAGVSFRY